MGMDVIGYAAIGDECEEVQVGDGWTRRKVPVNVGGEFDAEWLEESGANLPEFAIVDRSGTTAYFRNNFLGWGPLLRYMLAHHGSYVGQHWGSNDGDGLNGHMARSLAVDITRELNAGLVEEYARRDGGLACPNHTVDGFVENVRNWRDFLLVCGGFEIW